MTNMLAFLFHYGRWEMGFNDPNPTAWVITLLYAATAYLCFRAWRAEREHETSSAEPLWPRFWLVGTWLVAVMGVNKQLDLQSLLTEIGRDIFRALGLYGERRGIQFVFVIILATVGVAALYAGRRALGGFWKRYRLAYLGACGLATFVIIRGASFHHIDKFLYHTEFGKYWVNTLLEGGALATIAYAAWQAMKQRYTSKYQSHEKRVKVR